MAVSLQTVVKRCDKLNLVATRKVISQKKVDADTGATYIVLFNSCYPFLSILYNLKNEDFSFFKILHSSFLHLPFLRFHCVGGCLN